MEKDIEVAAESLKYAKRGRIHAGIGTSPFHIVSQAPIPIRRRYWERAVKAVKYAKDSSRMSEFYAEDAGRSDNVYLARVIEAVIKAGATVVNIPDTTGYCLPYDFGERSNS